jgi:ActR/RegA family two-component response regulator
MLQDRVLIVDDDPSWQELLGENIEDLELPGLGPRSVQIAGNFDDARNLLDRQHFHIAFVDLRLQEEFRELEGKKLARKIVELAEGTSIVIATGHADVHTAITALKEWKVLDFILKDEWEPEKVARLVQEGIPLARAAYRRRYESAVDVLRGDQDIPSWIAQALKVAAPDTSVMRPDQYLGDFLKDLLEDLYPLLPLTTNRDVDFDTTANIGQVKFWSKALAKPVEFCFGAEDAISQIEEKPSYLETFRSISDPPLEVAGIVGIIDEAFESFEHPLTTV